MTAVRGRHAGWLRHLALLGGGWLLDYGYAVYGQVRGLLSRQDPSSLLSRGTGAGSGAAPVLAIPGIYETWKFMLPLIRTVRRLGRPVHVLPTLGHNVATVPIIAARVEDYLREQDLTDVSILAHSKGGLIGKQVMVGPEGPRIRRMIAIATPFSGSRYATFALTPMLRAFAPSNPVLRTLLANLDANKRIVSIYSAFDPHIPGGSRLEGAQNIRLETVGHFRILWERHVHDVVAGLLRDGDQSGLGDRVQRD